MDKQDLYRTLKRRYGILSGKNIDAHTKPF